MALSVDDFLSRLEDSAVLDTDEVHALLTELPPEKRPKDAEQLAKELVRRKLLTSYQAQAIYQNKHKGLVLGNYVILDRLGQGGMGLVLKAEHRRMHRVVALKVLSPAATKSRDAVKRFHREVEAAAKLDHPNICTAFDADEAGGVNFLVMQFVDGSDLSVLVKSKGVMTVEKALHCIVEAARALEYAHSRGVIHRDVKPSNLLLDRDGHVKMLDMGLARIDGGDGQAELTATGEVMGTVDYMAPEQALNTKLADARCDIYSLGYTLWYLLVGKAAYPGDSLMAKLLAHRDQPVPSLLQARPDVPVEVDAIFRRMVAKQPTERFQTMSEVLSAIEQCRNGSTAPSLQAQRTEDSRLVSFLNSEQPARSTAATMKTKAGSSIDQPILVFDPPDPGSIDKRRSGSVIRRSMSSWKPPPWLSDPRAIAGLTAAGVFIATLTVLAIISYFGRAPTQPPEPVRKLKATPLTKSKTAPDKTEAIVDDDPNWTHLFNGRDLDGWQPIGTAAVWSVDKGVLNGRGKFGWLASNAQYDNFELALDYRLPKGGNSGVFLRAWPDGDMKGAQFLEIQLLDDSAPEFKGIKPDAHSGALFEIAAPTQKINTTPDKWHALRVKLVGDHLEVEHDGTKCLDFRLSGAITTKQEAVNRKTGQIGLQSYGPGCSFRDVRVRRLDANGKSVAAIQTVRPGWIELFDGKSLQGWVQHGGSAQFRAENGEIIGTSVPFTPSSFLCTMGGYRDFELELEFKVEAPLNSGVQIRSQYADTSQTVDFNGQRKQIPGQTVYGYQVDIDPVDRWSTGGIYEEAGRGWLSNPSNNAGETAFKSGQWNRLGVECRGNTIRTWLNGILAVEVRDSAATSGFIALQVHKVADKERPREVRFRNIQIKRL